jgi:hypothetical protein
LWRLAPSVLSPQISCSHPASGGNDIEHITISQHRI